MYVYTVTVCMITVTIQYYSALLLPLKNYSRSENDFPNDSELLPL